MGRITATLPIPPSVNHLYIHCAGRVVLSSEARHYLQTAGVALPAATLPEKTKWQLVVKFTFPSWRRDLDNALKLMVDVVAQRYGINDRYLTYLSAMKQVVPGQETAQLILRWDDPPDEREGRKEEGCLIRSGPSRKT